jgi:hypothetical protein
MKEVIRRNRQTLKKVDRWLDDDVYEKSVYHYGLPAAYRDLIDCETDKQLTYTDLICFWASDLSKPLRYFEIGVSAGKNFFQIMNYFNNAEMTGFDIEAINPTLEAFLSHRAVVAEWPTMPASKKKTPSSLTHYEYLPGNHKVAYLSGDVFDEAAWMRLAGMKFNVIFSDAFHSKEALLAEHEFIARYDLLDEDDFLMVWDDLRGDMETVFDSLFEKFKVRYGLANQSKIRLRLNGWLGLNVHEIGVIRKVKLRG